MLTQLNKSRVVYQEAERLSCPAPTHANYSDELFIFNTANVSSEVTQQKRYRCLAVVYFVV